MADQQRDFFLGVLDERFPDLADHHGGLCPEGSYGPARGNWKQIALRLKVLCEHYGISDRMPRPIIPGDKPTLNKRIVEAAEVSPTGLSKHKGVAHCVHQYCYRLPGVQVCDSQSSLQKRTSGRRVCK